LFAFLLDGEDHLFDTVLDSFGVDSVISTDCG